MAEESSKRMVEALKIPSVSPSRLHAMEDSPDGAPTLSSSNPPSAVAVPKRPQHPSVESQLLCMFALLRGINKLKDLFCDVCSFSFKKSFVVRKTSTRFISDIFFGLV